MGKRGSGSKSHKASKSSSKPSHSYKSSYKSSNKSTHSKGAGSSKYKVAKDGWGGMRNFAASYGEKGPDGLQQGNKILQRFMEADAKASKK